MTCWRCLSNPVPARTTRTDLTTACSALCLDFTAAQYLRTGALPKYPASGADILSRWVDYREDRRTCAVGNGAGAVVMQAAERDQLTRF